MSALPAPFRVLGRNPLFALLNISGLALGVAVFLVLFLYVRFETGFDRGLPGWQRIWMVERTLQFPGNPEVHIPVSPGMSPYLAANHPELKSARMLRSDVAVRTGRSSVAEHFAQVDPAYFELFPFPALEGDPVRTLARPDGLVLTQEAARAYLGTGSAIGRTLTVLIEGVPHSYRVGAVLKDLPRNVTYRSALFVALPPAAKAEAGKGLDLFLALPEGARGAAMVRDFPAIAARYPDPDMSPDVMKRARIWLSPLADKHLSDAAVRTMVTVLAAVGVVALLLAIVNYVNLATARAGLRAREIAMRKVVGASRGALVRQLLGEALVAVAFATLVGLALTELGLPFVNTLGGTDLAISYAGKDSILLPSALLVLVVTLLAGLYPAFIVSGYQPAAVLASAQTPGGDRAGGRLRRVLVVLQFAIAIALMIGTAVMVAQTRYLQSANLGFGREGLLMVPSYADPALDAAQRRDLEAAIAALPGVGATATSGVVPGGGSYAIAPMRPDGFAGDPPMIVQAVVGDTFFETYRAQLLAGRWFDPHRFALDDASPDPERPGRTANIIINRTAAQRLGFVDPAAAIGRTVGLGRGSVRVVGVVGDIRFKSPREPVEAIAYSHRAHDLFRPVLAVRATGDGTALLAAIEATWRRIAPNVPVDAVAVDQALYESFYRQDAQRARLFTLGAVLAIVIGCLGLYGLASFDTERRVREIGIRKVLGASTADLVGLLLARFLRPVLFANVLAWPFAYFAMRHWLTGFDDRIALSPLYFAAAAVAALVIAAGTVAGRVWRVARASPAYALRYE